MLVTEQEKQINNYDCTISMSITAISLNNKLNSSLSIWEAVPPTHFRKKKYRLGKIKILGHHLFG